MDDCRKKGSTWRDRFSRKGQKGQVGSAAQTSSEPTATQPADEAEWKDSNDASGAQESSGSVQEVETTTTEKTSLTASLRKKWFKTKSSSQKSPSQQEAQPAACNSGMHVVHLTRRVPQSSAPRVTVGSLQQWLDTSAPPPYESALSFEATSAHNAHLEYCETTLTRMLEAAYLKGVQLPEESTGGGASQSAADWENEASSASHRLALWISANMDAQEQGPSSLTEHEVQLRNILLATLRDEASKQVSEADTQLRTTSQTGLSANLLNRTEILNGLAAALFPRHRHVFSESQRFCVKTPSGATSSIDPPATHPDHLSTLSSLSQSNGDSQPLQSLMHADSATPDTELPVVTSKKLQGASVSPCQRSTMSHSFDAFREGTAASAAHAASISQRSTMSHALSHALKAGAVESVAHAATASMATADVAAANVEGAGVAAANVAKPSMDFFTSSSEGGSESLSEGSTDDSTDSDRTPDLPVSASDLPLRDFTAHSEPEHRPRSAQGARSSSTVPRLDLTFALSSSRNTHTLTATPTGSIMLESITEEDFKAPPVGDDPTEGSIEEERSSVEGSSGDVTPVSHRNVPEPGEVLPSLTLTHSDVLASREGLHDAADASYGPTTPASTPVNANAIKAVMHFVPTHSSISTSLNHMSASKTITSSSSSARILLQASSTSKTALARSRSSPSVPTEGARDDAGVDSSRSVATGAHVPLTRARSAEALQEPTTVCVNDLLEQAAQRAQNSHASTAPSSGPDAGPSEMTSESLGDGDLPTIPEEGDSTSTTSTRLSSTDGGVASVDALSSPQAPASVGSMQPAATASSLGHQDRADASTRAQRVYDRAVASREAVAAFKDASQGSPAARRSVTGGTRERAVELRSAAGAARLAVDVFLLQSASGRRASITASASGRASSRTGVRRPSAEALPKPSPRATRAPRRGAFAGVSPLRKRSPLATVASSKLAVAAAPAVPAAVPPVDMVPSGATPVPPAGGSTTRAPGVVVSSVDTSAAPPSVPAAVPPVVVVPSVAESSEGGTEELNTVLYTAELYSVSSAAASIPQELRTTSSVSSDVDIDVGAETDVDVDVRSQGGGAAVADAASTSGFQSDSAMGTDAEVESLLAVRLFSSKPLVQSRQCETSACAVAESIESRGPSQDEVFVGVPMDAEKAPAGSADSAGDPSATQDVPTDHRNLPEASVEQSAVRAPVAMESSAACIVTDGIAGGSEGDTDKLTPAQTEPAKAEHAGATMQTAASSEEFADVLSPTRVQSCASDFTAVFSSRMETVNTAEGGHCGSGAPVATGEPTNRYVPESPVATTSGSPVATKPTQPEQHSAVSHVQSASAASCSHGAEDKCTMHGEHYCPVEEPSEAAPTCVGAASFWHQMLLGSADAPEATTSGQRIHPQTKMQSVWSDTLTPVPGQAPIKTEVDEQMYSSSQGPASEVSVLDRIESLRNAGDFISPASENKTGTACASVHQSSAVACAGDNSDSAEGSGTPTYVPNEVTNEVTLESSEVKESSVSGISQRVKMFQQLEGSSQGVGFGGRAAPQAASKRVAAMSTDGSIISEKVASVGAADRAAGATFQLPNAVPPVRSKRATTGSAPVLSSDPAALAYLAQKEAPAGAIALTVASVNAPVVRVSVADRTRGAVVKSSKWWKPSSWVKRTRSKPSTDAIEQPPPASATSIEAPPPPAAIFPVATATVGRSAWAHGAVAPSELPNFNAPFVATSDSSPHEAPRGNCIAGTLMQVQEASAEQDSHQEASASQNETQRPPQAVVWSLDELDLTSPSLKDVNGNHEESHVSEINRPCSPSASVASRRNTQARAERSTFITPTVMDTMGSASPPVSASHSSAVLPQSACSSDELMLPTAPTAAFLSSAPYSTVELTQNVDGILTSSGGGTSLMSPSAVQTYVSDMHATVAEAPVDTTRSGAAAPAGGSGPSAAAVPSAVLWGGLGDDVDGADVDCADVDGDEEMKGIDSLHPETADVAPTHQRHLSATASPFEEHDDAPYPSKFPAPKFSAPKPSTMHAMHASIITPSPSSMDRKPEALTKGPIYTDSSSTGSPISHHSHTTSCTKEPAAAPPPVTKRVPSALASPSAFVSAPSVASDAGYACDREHSLGGMSSGAWTLDPNPSSSTVQRASSEHHPDGVASIGLQRLVSPQPPQPRPSAEGSLRIAQDVEGLRDDDAGSPRMPQPPAAFLQTGAARLPKFLTNARSSMNRVVRGSSSSIEPCDSGESESESVQENAGDSSSSLPHIETNESDGGRLQSGQLQSTLQSSSSAVHSPGSASARATQAVTQKVLEGSEDSMHENEECFEEACAPTEEFSQGTFSSRVVTTMSLGPRVTSSRLGSRDETFSSWNFDTDASSQSHSVAYSVVSNSTKVMTDDSAVVKSVKASSPPTSTHVQVKRDDNVKIAGADLPDVSDTESQSVSDSAEMSADVPVPEEPAAPLLCGSFSTLEMQEDVTFPDSAKAQGEAPTSSENVGGQQGSISTQKNIEGVQPCAVMPALAMQGTVQGTVQLTGQGTVQETQHACAVHAAEEQSQQAAECSAPSHPDTATVSSEADASERVLDKAAPDDPVVEVIRELPTKVTAAEGMTDGLARRASMPTPSTADPTASTKRRSSFSSATSAGDAVRGRTSFEFAPRPLSKTAPAPSPRRRNNSSSASKAPYPLSITLPAASTAPPASALRTPIAGFAFSDQAADVAADSRRHTRKESLSDITSSASLRLFADSAKPTTSHATSTRGNGSSGTVAASRVALQQQQQNQPNLQPAGAPSTVGNAHRTVHAPHAPASAAQQRAERRNTTGSAAPPAFESALKSAAEASAVARKLGVASHAFAATERAHRKSLERAQSSSKSRSPERRRTANASNVQQAPRASVSAPGARVSSANGQQGGHRAPQMHADLQQQLQRLQAQVNKGQTAPSRPVQGGTSTPQTSTATRQQMTPQQMQTCMHACNAMYMQQQMASMQLAAHMHAAQHSSGSNMPGKAPPNLLKFALLRSLAQESLSQGDEYTDLASMPLRQGRQVLEKIQSSSSLAYTSGGSVAGSGGGSFMGSQSSLADPRMLSSRMGSGSPMGGQGGQGITRMDSYASMHSSPTALKPSPSFTFASQQHPAAGSSSAAAKANRNTTNVYAAVPAGAFSNSRQGSPFAGARPQRAGTATDAAGAATGETREGVAGPSAGGVVTGDAAGGAPGPAKDAYAGAKKPRKSSGFQAIFQRQLSKAAGSFNKRVKAKTTTDASASASSEK